MPDAMRRCDGCHNIHEFQPMYFHTFTCRPCWSIPMHRQLCFDVDNVPGGINIHAEPIGRIASPLRGRDQGKPVERRRRKAFRANAREACHAGWAAERNWIRCCRVRFSRSSTAMTAALLALSAREPSRDVIGPDGRPVSAQTGPQQQHRSLHRWCHRVVGFSLSK